jgi:hypothetical protein
VYVVMDSELCYGIASCEDMGRKLMSRVLDSIKEHRVLITYRGMRSEKCSRISQELIDVGVRLFEVTTNSNRFHGREGKGRLRT